MTRSRKISAALLVAVATFGASDASARRMTDYKCASKPGGGWKLCGTRPPAQPQGPIRLSAPETCHTQNVLAVARATDPSQVRKLTLRLDGAPIGATRPGRPDFIGVGVDCASLSVGVHTLTATLLRRDGTSVKADRTLTRLEGTEYTAFRRHTDGWCRTDKGLRRCAVDTSAPKAAVLLQAPSTCDTRNVLASAKARNASQVRRLTLRLDGQTIGTTSRARPNFVGVGVDCAALTVGEHVLSATLVRRDGTSVKITRKLTRLAGETPAELADLR